MISALGWKLDREAGTLSCQLDKPPRTISIRWDEGDMGLYLSVHAPAPPNTDQGERLYACPLPLLAALTIVPPEHHGALVAGTQHGRGLVEGEVLEAVQVVVDKAAQAWPAPSTARGALRDAVEHAEKLERLALDLAAADAYAERGQAV